jgi:hypothetical protein
VLSADLCSAHPNADANSFHTGQVTVYMFLSRACELCASRRPEQLDLPSVALWCTDDCPECVSFSGAVDAGDRGGPQHGAGILL